MQGNIRDLKDTYAERMIITGLLNHGSAIFYDIDNLITTNYFALKENKVIYGAIKELIANKNIEKPDISAIIGIIGEDRAEKLDITEYILALSEDFISKDNIQPFVQKVARLALGRELKTKLLESVSKIEEISGEEKLTQIISIAEDPIVNFVSKFLHQDDLTDFRTYYDLHLQYLEKNRNYSKGLATGFPRWDAAIGGGLRKPGVHLMGGRAKSGKSFIAMIIAKFVASQNIPVLFLDSELTKEIMMNRLLSSLSGVPIEEIEDGVFFDDPKKGEAINKIRQDIEALPFYYYNISARNHKEWLSLIRRWLMSEVGFDEDGNMKECLVVLDYIKTMNLEDLGHMAEFQYLGQVITDLHNTAIQYNIPILAMVQLNREGINRSDQDVIAGSDRLIGLCSSCSILKRKHADDLAAEPISTNRTSGDRKIEVIVSRFGPGLPEGCYINVWSDLSRAIMVEGRTNLENRNINDSDNDDITL